MYNIRRYYIFSNIFLRNCIDYMFDEYINVAKIDSFNTLFIFFFSFQTMTIMNIYYMKYMEIRMEPNGTHYSKHLIYVTGLGFLNVTGCILSTINARNHFIECTCLVFFLFMLHVFYIVHVYSVFM